MAIHRISPASSGEDEALSDMTFVATDGSLKSCRHLVDSMHALASDLRAAVAGRIITDSAAIEGLAAILDRTANTLLASVAEEVDVDRL